MEVEMRSTHASPTVEKAEVRDEFYYGHRLVTIRDESGRETFVYRPLTLEDFLDPQEGDHFVQGTLHHEDVAKAVSIFRYLYRDDPTVAVFSDLKMVWDIEGLPQPAPDVAVVPNVEDPHRPRQVFDVALEGTRPRFILEIVSPRYREADRKDKVAIYEQAGVEEYVIIDPWLQEDGSVACEVLGYRMEAGRYVAIPPDDRGRIYSTTDNVWIGVTEARDGFVVVDGETGAPVLPAEEWVRALEAELARLRKGEIRQSR